MHAALFALGVTLVVETPVVAAAHPKERLRMAAVAVATNTVTNLFMNTVLYRLTSSYSSYLLIGEIGTVLVEAAVYFFASRERDVGRALVASALANAASFGAGLVLG